MRHAEAHGEGEGGGARAHARGGEGGEAGNVCVRGGGTPVREPAAHKATSCTQGTQRRSPFILDKAG